MSAMFEQMEDKLTGNKHLKKALREFRTAGGDKKKFQTVVDGHKNFQTAMKEMTEDSKEERLFYEQNISTIRSRNKHVQVMNGDSDDDLADADADADAGGPEETAEETPADDDDDDDDDDEGDEKNRMAFSSVRCPSNANCAGGKQGGFLDDG